MGAAFYPVFERPIDGFGPAAFNGKSLARAADALDRLAEKARLTPLMSFFSVSIGELASFVGPEEAARLAKQRPEKWWAASSGLNTVRGLLRQLEKKGHGIPNPAGVVADLQAMEAALLKANDEKVRWHLAGDN